MSRETAYNNYITLMARKKRPMLVYECPSCGKGIKTQQPPKGEEWDGCGVCPFCDGMHLKVSTHEGVEVKELAI